VQDLHPHDRGPRGTHHGAIIANGNLYCPAIPRNDYPSAAWRRSYARRTGAERGFATVKDPATSDISRGWCHLMGLAPLMLFTVTLQRSRMNASPGDAIQMITLAEQDMCPSEQSAQTVTYAVASTRSLSPSPQGA